MSPQRPLVRMQSCDLCKSFPRLPQSEVWSEAHKGVRSPIKLQTTTAPAPLWMRYFAMNTNIAGPELGKGCGENCSGASLVKPSKPKVLLVPRPHTRRGTCNQMMSAKLPTCSEDRPCGRGWPDRPPGCRRCDSGVVPFSRRPRRRTTCLPTTMPSMLSFVSISTTKHGAHRKRKKITRPQDFLRTSDDDSQLQDLCVCPRYVCDINRPRPDQTTGCLNWLRLV